MEAPSALLQTQNDVSGEKAPPARTGARWGLAIQSLGLAWMVGGMLVLGAFVAPAVFGSLPRAEAAPLMGTLFRRYDQVLLVALGLVWLGEILQGWRSGLCPIPRRPLPLLRVLLLLGLTACLLTATLGVNPAIERMQRAGLQRTPLTAEGQAFERTHRLSETLYKADLLLATLLLLLTPFTLANPGRKQAR